MPTAPPPRTTTFFAPPSFFGIAQKLGRFDHVHGVDAGNARADALGADGIDHGVVVLRLEIFRRGLYAELHRNALLPERLALEPFDIVVHVVLVFGNGSGVRNAAELARFLKDLDGVAALRGVDGKVHAGGPPPTTPIFFAVTAGADCLGSTSSWPVRGLTAHCG